MKNLWVRFGCFLIGYNYDILRNSSEASAKTVKRYTAALLIISILWGFIGYVFTDRYMHGGSLASLSGAIAFIIIIIQVERQIILTNNPNKTLKFSRGALAVAMAILGSVIIDQIIFKDDIELEKITYTEKRIKKTLESKTEELNSQIKSLDSAIAKNEKERLILIADINKNPTSAIKTTSITLKTEKTTKIDSSTGKPIITEKSIPQTVTSITSISNPNIPLVKGIEESIINSKKDKTKKQEILLNIRPIVEKQIMSKVGFLDELNIMFKIITGSRIALIVWLLWFIFLFGIEMLILISKSNDKVNDYEKIINHHMDMQIKQIDLFNKMAETKQKT